MRALAILLIAAMLCTNTIGAQDGPTNLEKYWMYKERQKNYRLVGDCQGCSLPVGARSSSDLVEWRDQTGEQGYYIATLAMEYKMRLDHGLPVADVDRELFYAIESLNRLDIAAEYWWEYYYNQDATPTGVLNGFLIRDDVPADFFNRMEYGDLVENHFNRSMFATQFGYGAHTVSSGFTRGPGVVCPSTPPLGPEEMSQDHAIAILAGLAVVVKLIPAIESYGNLNFADGQSSFAQEAKNIVFRIVSYAKDGDPTVFDRDWLYINPVTHVPVQGIEWNECIPPGAIDLGVRNVGGASFRFLSYGFAMSASQIINDFDEQSADTYYQNNFDGGISIANSKLNFLNDYRNHAPSTAENEDYKVLLLAAVSNMWDEDTEDILGERFDAEYQNGAEVHVPQAVLLNNILYGNAMTVPNSVWECMLNSAPCTDMAMSTKNFEWSHGHGRFLYGPNVPHYFYDDQQSGLAYLYFFNIYNIANTNYLGNNYSIIDGGQVVNTNLTISPSLAYVETEHKNYFASNEITTQNSYIISNDNDLAQLYAAPLDAANVTFAAGQAIVLNPGFQVTAGSNFHAYIDPTLTPRSCEFDNNSSTCTNCKVSGSEENLGGNIGASHVIVVPLGEGQCFLAFEHHLFKVDLSHAHGTTMFGIGETDDCSNFPCSDPACAGDRRYSVIGYQNFNFGSDVVDIKFTGADTYIALTGPTSNHKGRIVKINGTGGVGPQMMGLTEDAFGIIQGGSHFGGRQNFFAKEILFLEYMNQDLFIVFKDEMVKVGSSTLSNAAGADMFDVTIDNNQNFVWGSSSFADCGDQQFGGVATEITEIAQINSELFVCTKTGAFEHGKILKLSGTGGTGHNMFGVDDSPSNNDFAYDPLAGYFHYSGDEFFKTSYQCYVTKIVQVGTSMMVAFRNGRVLKLQGTGGSGHHMFNVEEVNSGFGVYSLSISNYLEGSQDFENLTWANDIDYIGGATYVTCYNGKVLKVSDNGGTGLNMFNVDANSGYGFTTTNSNSNVYMLGCADFRMNMYETQDIDGHLLISIYPGVLLNLNGSGTGNNMFALAYQEDNSFKSLCGNFYFEGSEDFTDLCEEGGNRMAPLIEDSMIVSQGELFVYPNPAADVLNFKFHTARESSFRIEIYDAIGQLVSIQEFAWQDAPRIDVSYLTSGLYVIKLIQEDAELYDKVMIYKQL